MIASDQPTIFGKEIIAAVSSVSDGNMKFGIENDDVLKNRQVFLENLGIDLKNTTLVTIDYSPAANYTQYRTLNDSEKAGGMFAPDSETIADALVVTKPGHALFLPLADCVGVILHDAVKGVLMVSHVGRHSAEVDGAKKSVHYLMDSFASRPADIRAWLSPAVGKASYPVHALGDKGLHEIIVEQLLGAGLRQENIEVSAVDTARDKNYFSHSEYLAGNRDSKGRFAVVAMMMGEQGEPAA
ncbi:MAG: polyphenol oxidase family protein [Candidatus Saccharibacteria bacterium]|nr:MAG: polyphenol oxidase family protein [Candidatus Saccharibacteria bacterium]